MFKSLLKITLGLLLLPAVMFGTFAWMEKSGYFNLEEVQIELPTFSNSNRYFSNLISNLRTDMKTFEGASLARLNLEHVGNLLKTYTWIETFEVKRRWPSSIVVYLQTKKMVALFLSQKDSKFYPVLEDGTFLASASTDSLPDLPILQGEVFVKDSNRRLQAISLINDLPNDGKFSRQKISEVRFDDKDGFWVTLLESAVKVKLGEDQFSLKASRVSQVIEYMENRDLQARVIDANLSKKVLVRLRKDP